MGDEELRESIRQELELFWVTKLQRARERYFKAATELCQRVRGHKGNDSELGDMRREEAEAFADYCRILATYTELVAMGKVPAGERPKAFEIPQHPE